MKRRSLVAGVGALAALAVGAGLATAVTAPAREAATAPKVRVCATLVYPLSQGLEVYVTSARNLTCAAAARDMRRTTWTGNRVFRTKGGFVCRGVGRGELGYQIRCVRGDRAYRIEFVD